MSSRFHRKVSLKPFAPPQNGIVHALDVHLQELTQETLSLRYTLHAEVTRLRIPATTRKPQHTDELWKHTCFEMFVRKAPGATAYYELNFSPSTEWALYAFEGYHKNPVSIDPARPPQIRVKREASAATRYTGRPERSASCGRYGAGRGDRGRKRNSQLLGPEACRTGARFPPSRQFPSPALSAGCEGRQPRYTVFSATVRHTSAARSGMFPDWTRVAISLRWRRASLSPARRASRPRRTSKRIWSR